MENTKDSCGVMILAAGLGKRMRSSLPKVLHEIGGQPLLFHILDRVLESAPKARIAIVVGHGREQVESRVRAVARYAIADLAFVHQPEQRGTGHAARCAIESARGKEWIAAKLPVLVVPGDMPLVSAETVREMLKPLRKSAALRILTTEVPDARGYGRIIRKGASIRRIVEEKDATAKEKLIREINTSVYLFDSKFLQAGVAKLSDKNAQGELYLTDLVAQAVRAKRGVDVLKWPAYDELRGINDQWELAEAEKALNLRTLRKWGQAGVRFILPETTLVEPTVELAEGVTVYPGATLQGATRVGKGSVIGPRVKLNNVVVGEQVELKAGTTAAESAIGDGAMVGPYAHLRPESQVGAGSKIGNFVELKKARIGKDTSIAHLSYLGDATVGDRVNIGCGFVTCNFDGRVIDGERKHKTVIEDDVFLGSDCQAVAPVRIGRGAYVASGSTITEDVEADALAIARSRQTNKPGYAKKLRGGQGKGQG